MSVRPAAPKDARTAARSAEVIPVLGAVERPEMPAEAQALAASARVLRSPCGKGDLVWHVWGGEGPTVVLLHGGSGSWTHWLRSIPPLVAAGHAVWVPDLPGFGDSAAPTGGQDADASVAPLLQGLDTFLPGPLDLVGFSFGSLVSALLATQLPRLRHLVLLGAPILPLPMGKGVPLKDWRHLQTMEARNTVHAHNLRALMLHRDAEVTPAAIALHAHNVARDRMRRRRLTTTSLLGDTLGRITCPTWLLYGAEDVLYRDRWTDVAHAVRSMPAVRRLTLLPDAGHWVQHEAADEVNALLAQLLRTPAPGTA